MASKALYLVVLILGLLTLVAGDHARFNYNIPFEKVWQGFLGSQCGGLRQSPINIQTALVEENSALIPLSFHDYDQPLDGEFENIGTTVRFVPDAGNTVAVSNHKGIYDLRWIDFHWGCDDTQGSEHRVNGMKNAAEIQFVHLKRGVPPGSTDPDAYSILSVLADVDSGAPRAPAAGSVWSTLSVPKPHATSTSVFGSQYDELLPTNRNYYFYEGSFTTPLCTENVEWFVLKNTINIPTGFLINLRSVEKDAGTPPALLNKNFRNPRDLNARNVFEFPAA